MLWAMFGVLLAITVVSALIDIENSQKSDHEGISRNTVYFVVMWVILGISRELIEAIDPLL
jgi:hypothetical protein